MKKSKNFAQGSNWMIVEIATVLQLADGEKQIVKFLNTQPSELSPRQDLYHRTFYKSSTSHKKVKMGEL